MHRLDRRKFLKDAAIYSGALLAPSLPGLGRVVETTLGGAGAGLPGWWDGGAGGYGPLREAGPDLALPEGFSYSVFGVEGSEMSDGAVTPGAHDGMAAFALPNGNIRLVRNHEHHAADPKSAVAFGNVERAYDPRGVGGTTSLEVRVGPDGAVELMKDFFSVNGTLRNCAGGPTPWGSWLTCEETTWGPSDGYGKPHGYVFEVPVLSEREADPQPIKAMGRFVHEAIAVDPRDGVVYLTEDSGTAGLYRYIPTRPGELLAGGQLQMLRIQPRSRADLRRGQAVGVPLRASWVDIDHPDPDEAEERSDALFIEGFRKGGATFARLEGAWWGDDSVYVNATSGGDRGLGQVWRYRPDGESEGDLILVFESPHESILQAPDNICYTPKGGLLLCEDGGGEQFVRGITPRGEIFDFAKNIGDHREFAGATFSPDGRVLFLNIQGGGRYEGRDVLGRTFAIWGPWDKGAL